MRGVGFSDLACRESYPLYAKPHLRMQNHPFGGTITPMGTATEQPWTAALLAEYPPMMTLSDVATVLNIEPRKLRSIVRHPDPQTRITATKINNVWRFPRDELAAYLLAHENARSGVDHA